VLGGRVQFPSAAQARPSLTALQAQVNALKTFQNEEPVVIDGSGQVVGRVIGVFERNSPFAVDPWVQIDLEELPLFAVPIARSGVLGNDALISFESGNCTGQAWLKPTETPWGNVVALVDSQHNRTFYVTDASDVPQPIFVLSQLRNDEECTPADFNAQAVQLTPIDLDSMFTPPFLVVTRGDLS